jgi:hypothetical protein
MAMGLTRRVFTDGNVDERLFKSCWLIVTGCAPELRTAIFTSGGGSRHGIAVRRDAVTPIAFEATTEIA